MLVFAAETSCDETSICLMKDREILEHLIYSQEIHKNFGGVVPELASRSHLEKLQEMTRKLIKNSDLDLKKIDVFTATCGPGLIGSLLVGATFVKSLSINYEKPFIPMNHLEGHVLSTSFNNEIEYPHLVLLLTGGHTQIYLMENFQKIELLGGSVDDAIGEAFDKVAKLIGLGYPGGAEIENMAKHGNENYFEIPKPLIKEKNYNFSFSGIKTHINLLTKKNKVNDSFIRNVSASFQKTVSEIIISKLDTSIKLLNEKSIQIKSISIVGGVAKNNYINKKLQNEMLKENIKLFYPIDDMMTDNAAMIAWSCIKNFKLEKNDIFFKPDPRMKISENL